MAKFCKFCGKEIKEGETCSCKKEQKQEVSSKKEERQSSDVVKDYFNGTMDVIRHIFKKPIDTVEENKADSNFGVSCVLIVISALIAGLFTFLFCKEFISSLYSSLFGYSSYLYSSTNVDVPYGKIFIYTVLAQVAFYFLEAFVAYIIINKGLKKDVTFKNTLNVIGTLTIFISLAMIIAIIGIYISIYVILIALVLGSLLYTYNLVLSLKDVLKVDSNKVAYVLCGVVAVVYIVAFIVTKIFS